MNNNSIVSASYNGKLIQGRKEDGFINLTQMCSANNKRLDNWLRLKQTQEYIASLECSLRSEESLLKVVKGNFSNGQQQGTWGHPLLAINLSRWISPSFAVWCDANIFVLIAEGKALIDPISRMEEILEDYAELNLLMENDERFYGLDSYSDWSQ